jgi:hypothetical protein
MHTKYVLVTADKICMKKCWLHQARSAYRNIVSSRQDLDTEILVIAEQNMHAEMVDTACKICIQ